MSKVITAGPEIDAVVSFDTTGSMYPVLSSVRNNVVDFVKRMFNNVPNLKIGIVAHGDYCDKDDPYTIRIMDLTSDKDAICDFIRTTDRTYGGDSDECYELVLNSVAKHISWRDGSIKILLMIGDASPHGVNYPMNEGRLDWRKEARNLGEMGVKIFAVHALSYYRSPSTAFYKTIADVTGGKYLTLDQFNEVSDLIEAACISQYSETKLDEFVSIIQERGRFTKTLAGNLRILGNKSYGYDICSESAYGMTPVPPGRFQVMEVDENCDIKGFVIKNGTTFKRGRGFYELTKHETVQQYKEVIIQDRETGEMFTGPQVRERLGLSPQTDKGGVHESLSSRDTTEFRVFVQSTSVNRKLIAGTTFLYEVDDIDVVGTSISDIPMKVEKAEKAEGVATKTPKATKDTGKTKEKKVKGKEEEVRPEVGSKAKKVTKAKKATSKKTTTPSSGISGKLPPIPDDSDILTPCKVDDDPVEDLRKLLKIFGVSDDSIERIFKAIAEKYSK